MIDDLDRLLDRLRILWGGILIIIGIFLMSFFASSVEIKRVHAENVNSTSSTLDMDVSSSPNVITKGMGSLASGLEQTMKSVKFSPDNGIRSIASTITQGGNTVAHSLLTGISTTGRGIGSGLAFAGNKVSGGALFVLSLPSNVLGFISNTPFVSAIIRPSNSMQVPIIDPNSPELHAALKALPATKDNNTTTQGSSEPAWPIRGRITTQFGVPHWPYQRTHTGLDISDSQLSGMTPIKPFRPGRVVGAVSSSRGLGNHVIVDHGNGVTSVYGHMASIAVHEGQEVGLDTTLGLEGSTGASTGTHLHFEIRVGGQATDPHQFISGQP